MCYVTKGLISLIRLLVIGKKNEKVQASIVDLENNKIKVKDNRNSVSMEKSKIHVRTNVKISATRPAIIEKFSSRS